MSDYDSDYDEDEQRQQERDNELLSYGIKPWEFEEAEYFYEQLEAAREEDDAAVTEDDVAEQTHESVSHYDDYSDSDDDYYYTAVQIQRPQSADKDSTQTTATHKPTTVGNPGSARHSSHDSGISSPPATQTPSSSNLQPGSNSSYSMYPTYTMPQVHPNTNRNPVAVGPPQNIPAPNSHLSYPYYAMPHGHPSHLVTGGNQRIQALPQGSRAQASPHAAQAPQAAQAPSGYQTYALPQAPQSHAYVNGNPTSASIPNPQYHAQQQQVQPQSSHLSTSTTTQGQTQHSSYGGARPQSAGQLQNHGSSYNSSAGSSADHGSAIQSGKGYLYHYTDEAGIIGIESRGVIRKSTDTNRDAMLGEGVYFTDLPPETSDRRILINNYGGFWQGQRGKVTWCVRIPSRNLPRIQRQRVGDRLIYVHPGEINLNNVDYKIQKRDSH